jgi:hypothetical protein
VRSGDLAFKLGVSLREAFRDDIVHKALTVGQRVSGLATSETCVGVCLVMGHGADEEVDLLLT